MKLKLPDLTVRLISLANSIGGDDEELILQAVAALAQQAQPLSDEDARRAGDAYVASNHRYATRDDFVAGWSAALVAADKDRDFRATSSYYEKAIGGSDVCATCETHVVVMIEKEDHLPHKPGECACCDWHR